MGNVLAAFKLEIKIARFQQHLKQCSQGLTLEAIFVYNLYYRGLLKRGSSMSLVRISKAVVSHIDEKAMLQSVFYNIVFAILLVTVVGSTHLHVVCHHLSTDGSLKGPAPPPTPPPYPKACTTAPSPYLKVWIGHCYLSYVAVSWPCRLSKFYPNMASLYTVFFAHNIIIVTITIPTQQVYRVMRS